MTDLEFNNWLNDEVRAGRISNRQRDELQSQKATFDANRAQIERQHVGEVVGYAAKQQFCSGRPSTMCATGTRHDARVGTVFSNRSVLICF